MGWLTTPVLLLVALGAGLVAAGALSLVRAEHLLRAVVVAGALTAVWVPGTPTLVVWWDVLLRVGWCALVVWSAAFARRQLTAVALVAVALVAAATGSLASAASVACAAGALVAGQAIGGRARVPRAIAGVLVVHALTRLQWFDPRGASAVLGAVVTGVLFVSALRAARPSHRRVALRLIGAAGGVLAVSSLAALFAGLSASSELRQGASAARSALDAAERGDAQVATRGFASAARHFRSAQTTLDGISGRAGRLAPVFGSHVRAGATVAVNGRSLSRAGRDVAGGFETDELAVRSGRVDPAVAAGVAERLERVLPVVDRAARGLRDADSPWLVPPVSRRLAYEADRLARMHERATVAVTAATELPGLLGAHEERRYFLAVFTPAEARGLGGFLGNYGEIVASDGRLRLEHIGRTRELNQAAIASGATLDGVPRDYAARYARYAPEVTWQNVSMSPDFPTVAEVIRRLYPSAGGRDVDGVIAIDPIGLASLLKVSGPVTVPPWPVPITADNAERVLLHEQYLHLDGEQRVTFLGDVASAVTERLLATDVEPRQLMKALGPALAGHHVMLNSAKASEQRLFGRIGAAASVSRPRASDFLAITNQNAGGNKIDWFLRRSYRYAPRVGGDGRVAATLDVSIENRAPASGLPDLVIGNVSTPSDAAGTNRTFVSVYTPLTARSATVDGHRALFDSERELGLNVYTFYVPVAATGTSRISMKLTGTIDGVTADNYRVHVHRPALIAPDDVTVATAGRTMRGRLDRNRLFSLGNHDG